MEILHAAEFLAEYLCHNSHAQSFGQVVRVKVHLKKQTIKNLILDRNQMLIQSDSNQKKSQGSYQR